MDVPTDGYATGGVLSPKFPLVADAVRDYGALRLNPSLRLRVAGSSMIPSILPGDFVVVEPREINQFVPGEIALFSSLGYLVSHRVIAHHGTFLQTQGDSVVRFDPPVTEADLLGVVVRVERNGKSFAPTLHPGFVARCTAAVIRRSDVARRLWQRAYSLRNRVRSLGEVFLGKCVTMEA
jgi:hypothetical protein